MDIKEIVGGFGIEGEFLAYQPFGNGHINDAYALTFKTKYGIKRYILQRLNEHVFFDIDILMDNVNSITEFIRNKVILRGGNPDRESLNMLKTTNGKSYYTDKNNLKWRCMLLIEKTEAYQNAVNPTVFEATGKAFGEFIRMLDDFPVAQIKETIPNFHNTVERYKKFTKAIREDLCERRKNCIPEIQFAMKREKYSNKIISMLENGKIPVRVTHNDTKINNLLVDSETGDPVCVIDLDTIMPGSLLYDFGDGIRTGCNTAMEDEKNLALVTFNMCMFEHFTKGFVEGLGDAMTDDESENLALGAIIITYECGLRFLTDYLNGDKYFKVTYSEHNLVRARTQFKLLKEMEERFDEMNAVVNKYIASADKVLNATF